MSRDAEVRRFVRALKPGLVAARQGDAFVLGEDGPRASADSILALIGSGALDGDGNSCRANAETPHWLRRAYLEVDAFATQHRAIARTADGTAINRAESPLSKLATMTGGEGFLEPHHIEAGERVRRLVERAQLQPRLTMAYSASHTVGSSASSVGDISDIAAEARRGVASIHHLLPRDCAGVVFDVCGLLKGLQQVERERNWPRRSAKLVLRIGLDQLAQHYGLGPFVAGRANGKQQSWIGEGARPTRFE